MSGRLGESSMEGFMSAVISGGSLAWKPFRCVDNIQVHCSPGGPIKVAVSISVSEMRKEKLREVKSPSNITHM